MSYLTIRKILEIYKNIENRLCKIYIKTRGRRNQNV